MKTKLLKEVRKNFSITRVDKLGSNPDAFILGVGKLLGFPFYIIKGPSVFIAPIVKKELIEAKTELSKMIVNHYKEQFRHEDNTTTKIWYNRTTKLSFLERIATAMGNNEFIKTTLWAIILIIFALICYTI